MHFTCELAYLVADTPRGITYSRYLSINSRSLKASQLKPDLEWESCLERQLGLILLKYWLILSPFWSSSRSRTGTLYNHRQRKSAPSTSSPTFRFRYFFIPFVNPTPRATSVRFKKYFSILLSRFFAEQRNLQNNEKYFFVKYLYTPNWAM